jgi:hypothetical protein
MAPFRRRACSVLRPVPDMAHTGPISCGNSAGFKRRVDRRMIQPKCRTSLIIGSCESVRGRHAARGEPAPRER